MFFPTVIQFGSPDTTLAALHRVTAGAREEASQDYDEANVVLAQSRHWNDLAGGVAVGINVLEKDPAIREFMQIRLDELLQKTHEVQEILPTVKHKIRHSFEKARRAGFLDDTFTNEYVDGLLDELGVVVEDDALQDVVTRKDKYLGMYANNSDIITMSSHDEDTEATLIHEIIHRISGGTFVGSKNEVTKRVRSGLSDGDHHVGLDEALTELMTQAIVQDMEWDENLLDCEDGVYIGERTLLREFLDCTAGEISLATLVKAKMEDTAPRSLKTARREMIRETRKAYENGSLRKLDRLMKEIGDTPMSMLQEAIHGPHFNDSGVIDEKGWIHVDDYDESLSQ